MSVLKTWHELLHMIRSRCDVQINVEGAVTVVQHIHDSHDTSGLNTGRQEVLYGTHNGVLGQLFLDQQAVKQGFVLKPGPHKGQALMHVLHAYSNFASNSSIVS